MYVVIKFLYKKFKGQYSKILSMFSLALISMDLEIVHFPPVLAGPCCGLVGTPGPCARLSGYNPELLPHATDTFHVAAHGKPCYSICKLGIVIPAAVESLSPPHRLMLYVKSVVEDAGPQQLG